MQFWDLIPNPIRTEKVQITREIKIMDVVIETVLTPMIKVHFDDGSNTLVPEIDIYGANSQAKKLLNER